MASKNAFGFARVTSAPSAAEAFERQQEAEKKALEVAPEQEPAVPAVQEVQKQVERTVLAAPAPASAPIAEKPAGTRGRPRKPATKHPVSMRFDESMVYRVKVLAARWGITQTRVLERLVDEAWAKEGLRDEYNVENKL